MFFDSTNHQWAYCSGLRNSIGFMRESKCQRFTRKVCNNWYDLIFGSVIKPNYAGNQNTKYLPHMTKIFQCVYSSVCIRVHHIWPVVKINGPPSLIPLIYCGKRFFSGWEASVSYKTLSIQNYMCVMNYIYIKLEKREMKMILLWTSEILGPQISEILAILLINVKKPAVPKANIRAKSIMV